MTVQGFTVEAGMVVMTAAVGWMVVKPEVRVVEGEGAVTLGWVGVVVVEFDVLCKSSVMVTLLQDLQHMRR